ncbi:hypothetical protein A7D00_5783 [Trichophyton violaceum]|uniref:Uncharacterized protein n=1 Tax=Trichophyton violaceum TaxID=34388 RepID=A0A178FCI4_TRIVO|nr:hypothetical protein A7D00_5783 [Trichophyton violaceum]
MHCRDFECSKVQNVTDLPQLADCDLTVIPSTIPDFRALVDRYEIPSGFVLERLQGVTHSFGASLARDGSQAVWMHFLCTASSPDAENAEWLKSAAVLKWSTPTANRQTPNNQDKRHANGPVTLICFRPVEGICERIFHLAQESNWGDVLQDPYLLLDMVYESWCLRLDESAWKTNNLCQNIEKDAFKGTRDLDASFPGPPVVDLYYVHTIAKNAIFMLEAVDATLRSLDAAIAHHQELSYTLSPPQQN